MLFARLADIIYSSPDAPSSKVRAHSLGCQIRYILQSVKIFAAARGAALLSLFVCIVCAYKDVSDFHLGNILTLRRLLNNWSVLRMRPPLRFAALWEADKYPHMLLVLG